ncbi:hypothetical protein GCM10027093_14020 [Paraburkholderia jirisanensis]
MERGYADDGWPVRAFYVAARLTQVRLVTARAPGARVRGTPGRLKSYNLADFGRLPQCTNAGRRARRAASGKPAAVAQARTKSIPAQYQCSTSEMPAPSSTARGAMLHDHHGTPV